ncbi:MAG: Tim44 domain-containing protein [Candidatus Rokubacteria bacterium]|nr:Tim44 domain-containing protein [Candidatus Rokubacteria bacterium]
MKRFLAIACLVVVAFAPLLLVTDAWARAGGGSSGGSRGSRSYSSPARPSQSPAKPTQPSTPPSSFQQPQPQRSGWGAGLMGGLAGFALGGLLGSMLFGGGMGGGMGGGLGLMEILLIGGGIFLLYRMMKNRQVATHPAPSYGQGYGGSQPQAQPQLQMYQAEAVDTGPSELDRGVSHIRQMDSSFDPARFGDPASDIFFRVQAAWMARDMSQASASITPEMAATLQKDCDRLRGQGRINRLDNIAVRSVAVTEAWQENGQDYVTVHFLASLLDYTVEERSGQVVEGSRTEPVKFEEYWTFVRPVGPNAWRLSAIQQG